MREAHNNVHIEGILNEIDLKDIEYTNRRGEKVKAIAGTITVKVHQEINGVKKILEIPIQLFGNQYNSAGNPSPLYTSFRDIKDNYVSVAACGNEDDADRVVINNGRIQLHSYAGRNGKLISFPRISANFVNKVPRDRCKEQATFAVEFVVKQAAMEVNPQTGEETGRYRIIGVIPGWNDRIDVVPFYAVNEGVIDVVSSYWTPGDTVRANGKLDFSISQEEVTQPVDFGEPVKNIVTRRTSDLIVTGGAQAPLDGEKSYEAAEINQALAAWKAGQDDILEKSKAKAKAATTVSSDDVSSSSFLDFGFAN